MFGDSLAYWNGFRLACGSVVMVEAQAAVEVGRLDVGSMFQVVEW